MFPSRLPAQPLLAGQALVERYYRLPLVHDPGARLYHPVSMPQPGPQIAILPTRHPDLREAIFQHQLQNQLGILAIRFLFAYSLRPDLSGVSDPQIKLQFVEQPFKPARMPARFPSQLVPSFPVP